MTDIPLEHDPGAEALREMADILSTPGEADAIDEGLHDESNGRLIDGPTALSAYLPPTPAP